MVHGSGCGDFVVNEGFDWLCTTKEYRLMDVVLDASESTYIRTKSACQGLRLERGVDDRVLIKQVTLHSLDLTRVRVSHAGCPKIITPCLTLTTACGVFIPQTNQP